MKSALESISATANELLNGAHEIQNSPKMMSVLFKIDARLNASHTRENIVQSSPDTFLAILISHLGFLPISMGNKTESTLLNIAAICVGWLETLGGPIEQIAANIADERIRQRRLFLAKKHSYQMESASVSNDKKIRVLAKMIGKLAAVTSEVERRPNSAETADQLRRRITQVAAVTVAWLESLEAQ